MAVTEGHGNPDWTREETILALDLYLECDKRVPAKSDPRVLELSRLLNSLPWPPHVKRNEKFRNPDGVTFKLHNLRSAEFGHGLQNTSKQDREIITEFLGHPEAVRELSKDIRMALKQGIESEDLVAVDDDIEFYEGRLLTALHKRRERDPRLRRKLIAHRQKHGILRCEICSWPGCSVGPKYADAGFEVHHLKPLGMGLTLATKLVDMSILCATCHRLVHRAISIEKRWLSIDECKSILL